MIHKISAANKYNNSLIMKKYEKVNLTSQIYRDKTRSKSPILLKNIQSSQHNNFAKNFHNVCCPNCKYLFKIPKQSLGRPKTPTNNVSTRKQKQKDFMAQTEQYLMSPFKTSPKREKLDRDELNSIRYIQTDRTPEKPPHFAINSVQFDNNNSPDRDRSSERNKITSGPMLKKDLSPRKANEKISKLQQSATNRGIFPARSAYLKQSSATQRKKQNRPIQSSIALNRSPSPHNFSQQKSQTQAQDHLNEINRNLVQQLLRKIKLTEQINQIIKYQSSIKVQTSVPSYCKMLMYDLRESREQQVRKYQTDRQSRLQSNGKQDNSSILKDSFYKDSSDIRSKVWKDTSQNLAR